MGQGSFLFALDLAQHCFDKQFSIKYSIHKTDEAPQLVYRGVEYMQTIEQRVDALFDLWQKYPGAGGQLVVVHKG